MCKRTCTEMCQYAFYMYVSVYVQVNVNFYICVNMFLRYKNNMKKIVLDVQCSGICKNIIFTNAFSNAEKR